MRSLDRFLFCLPQCVAVLVLVSVGAGCNVGAKASTAVGETGGIFVADPGPANKLEARQEAAKLNEFAFALAKESMPDGTSNQLVSPLSMGMCLTMLLNGTSGMSASELAKTLRIDPTGLDKANEAYVDILRRAKVQNGVEISIANAIWTFRTASPKQPFITKMKTTFDAEIAGLNVPDDSAVKRINEWVSQNTKARIPKLFETLDQMTVMVLTNAIAFDGKWSTQFDPSLTTKREFRAASGPMNVEMMTRDGKGVRYAEADGMKAIWLPYRGNGFSMAFVLPKQNEPVSSLLNSAVWKKLDSAATPSEGTVRIPRFTFSAGYDMIGALKQMGAHRMFEFSHDFDSIVTCRDTVKVDQVVHKTFIQVDEKGTKAAAATGIALGTKSASASPSKRFVFEANRPFLFAIVDNHTGGIAFLGAMNDPTSK